MYFGVITAVAQKIVNWVPFKNELYPYSAHQQYRYNSIVA